MHEITLLLVLVVALALVFDFINGFHDTANAVATVIATRVLTPRQAILMSGILNFAGAMVATAVATTIAKGVIDPKQASETVVLAAVLGAITWNLVTWVYGIPSSSSHALVGGLIGAGMAKGGESIVQWQKIFDKIILPLIFSPIAGFIIGLILMSIITFFFARSHPLQTGPWFKKLQLLSSAAMSFVHGQNDGQKSMGIITLALFAHHIISKVEVPVLVKVACAIAMGLGTSAGGYRIIATVGHRILRLEPVQGFTAETTGASVILTASHFGWPVSTTHIITGSVFGVGAARRLSAVRWKVAIQMVCAWVITIPASALVAGLAYKLINTVTR
ncbi:MAG TPA: inorganic phosphate transporter [Fimbriimonas sp.]|nr:inorganic phosphate transporter [Fimbriimonas sp.]